LSWKCEMNSVFVLMIGCCCQIWAKKQRVRNTWHAVITGAGKLRVFSNGWRVMASKQSNGVSTPVHQLQNVCWLQQWLACWS